MAGKREFDSPLAGKSTLNRLELSRANQASTRYHKISYSSERTDHLLLDLFLESHTRHPRRIVLDLDWTDIPLPGHSGAAFPAIP